MYAPLGLALELMSDKHFLSRQLPVLIKLSNYLKLGVKTEGKARNFSKTGRKSCQTACGRTSGHQAAKMKKISIVVLCKSPNLELIVSPLMATIKTALVFNKLSRGNLYRIEEEKWTCWSLPKLQPCCVDSRMTRLDPV